MVDYFILIFYSLYLVLLMVSVTRFVFKANRYLDRKYVRNKFKLIKNEKNNINH